MAVENGEIVEQDVVVTVEPTAEVVETTEVVADEVQKEELNDERVFEYLKTKRPELESVEDLWKEKVVEKEVNPYEGVEFDDYDKQYITFKKETGRSYKEFEFLNTDFSKMSKVDAALELVKRDFPNHTNEDRIAYLEGELGIVDLNDELTVTEQMKLDRFAKSFIDEKKAEQDKFRQPIEKKEVAKVAGADDGFMDLGNGTKVTKEAYDNWAKNKQMYDESVKNPANRVAEEKLIVTFDNNGKSEDIDVSYKYSEEGLRRAELSALDIESYQNKRYANAEGVVDTAKVKRDMYILDNFESIVKSITDKTTAHMVENFTKWSNNTNFNRDGLPTTNQDGVRVVPISQVFNK